MSALKIRRVPLLDLMDAELATAAQACRAMAHQEGKRARRMENPTTRGLIETAANRYLALADKLEGARKGKGLSAGRTRN